MCVGFGLRSEPAPRISERSWKLCTCVHPELDFQTRTVMNILIPAKTNDALHVIYGVCVCGLEVSELLYVSVPSDSC